MSGTPAVLFDALAIGQRPSGTRTRLLGLVPELRARGCRVTVLAGSDLDEEARRLLGPKDLVFEPRPPRGRIGRLLCQGRIHRRAEAACHPDLVVAECLPWPESRRLVGVVHDLRHLQGDARGRMFRRVLQDGLRRALQVHAVSEAVANELRAEFPGADVRVVPNGVDGALYRPGPVADDAAALARRRLVPRQYVLWVGHLEPRKDPWTALRCREEMARRHLDVPLVMVGKGPVLAEEEMTRLRALFRMQDPGRVLRDVEAPELACLYRNAAVVIATAREEGFGMAPLEALACGVPVVASDLPAHREVLDAAARLCRPGDVSSFLDAVLAVVERREDRSAAIAAGLDRAAHYSWPAAATAFLDAVDGLPVP